MDRGQRHALTSPFQAAARPAFAAQLVNERADADAGDTTRSKHREIYRGALARPGKPFSPCAPVTKSATMLFIASKKNWTDSKSRSVMMASDRAITRASSMLESLHRR